MRSAPRPTPAPGRPPGLPRSTLRAGQAIYAALLLLLFLFLLMVEEVNPPPMLSGHAPIDLLLGLAVLTSILGVVLSHVLPPRLTLRQGGGRADAAALVRSILAWALVCGVAIFPLVAHLLSRDDRQLLVFGADVLALLTLYPRAERWARLAASPESGPGRGGERVR